ncbi:MAG: 3-keto-5-aminohexanoate cleavage protein [Rhodospirillales bacterium]|nr:3-keto-5-aminohexanoate cleavage protein [Rhodospirillales bacterium]
MKTTSPVIVSVAPTGARKTRADHPALPVTPDEIAREAKACMDAGAALLHLHVRDAEGRHSIDPDAYRIATSAVRKAVGDDLIVQVTTEAVGMFNRQQQMAAVRDLRPEAVSLAIRELVPDAGAEDEAADFCAWMKDEGVLPQYIVYDAADLSRFFDLQKNGVIKDEHPFVLFVLGRYLKDRSSRPDDLLPFLDVWRGEAGTGFWGVCAFGPAEGACALTAAALGGHPRIGFENNTLLSDGALAPDNAALIRQLTENFPDMGVHPMTAQEARAMLR